MRAYKPSCSFENQINADMPPASHPLDGLKVLLAEDCIDQGRLCLRFLQMEGAEVTLECSGRSAVDAVRKAPTLFDIIVMNFQMPEMDGIESTRKLRELGYGGLIIAVTAYGSEDLKQSWLQAGCDEYFEKPLKIRKAVDEECTH